MQLLRQFSANSKRVTSRKDCEPSLLSCPFKDRPITLNRRAVLLYRRINSATNLWAEIRLLSLSVLRRACFVSASWRSYLRRKFGNDDFPPLVEWHTSCFTPNNTPHRRLIYKFEKFAHNTATLFTSSRVLWPRSGCLPLVCGSDTSARTPPATPASPSLASRRAFA